MLSLKVACLGSIDDIEYPKTKEIILNNKIQHFCRELKSEFLKKKIRSRLEIDGDNREKVNSSFILAHPLESDLLKGAYVKFIISQQLSGPSLNVKKIFEDIHFLQILTGKRKICCFQNHNF